MPFQVVNSALLQCSFAFPPGIASFIVEPLHRTLAGGQPAANILDSKPLMNIPTFGMCQSPANPEVISATAAAMGVLTPMPCVPNTVAPWTPGAAQTILDGAPALDDVSICMCMWGGVIKVDFAGQATVQID